MIVFPELECDTKATFLIFFELYSFIKIIPSFDVFSTHQFYYIVHRIIIVVKKIRGIFMILLIQKI